MDLTLASRFPLPTAQIPVAGGSWGKLNHLRPPSTHSIASNTITNGMAMTATATATAQDKKHHLLRVIQDTQRGLLTNADQRSRIEEALVSLETSCSGAPIDLERLDGTWRLQYTSAPDVLILLDSAARFPFFQAGTRQMEELSTIVVKWSFPKFLESPMASHKTSSALKHILLAVTLVMLSVFVGSDLAQDRAECTDQLVGLATCLPYVNGDGKVPPQDCCSGLRIVLQKSLKCLCILVRDRNDPDLGIKVNTTLALSLPSSCNAPVNISKCIDILQLAPTSADAKVFSDFEKSLETNNTAQAPSINASSGGSPATRSRFSSGRMVRSPFSASQCLTGALIWIYARELFLSL